MWQSPKPIVGLAVPGLAIGAAVMIGIPGAASGLVSKQNTITIPAPSGQVRSGGMGLRCKGARRAWAGGFATTFRPAGGQRVLPDTSRKPQRPDGGREWIVGAENRGREAGTLTGYVYCRKANRLRASRWRGVTKRGPGRGEFTRTVRCGRGSPRHSIPHQGRVVSGGFQATGGVRIYGSRKTGPRRWSVSWLDPHPEKARPETMAYCRPGPNTKPRRNAVRVKDGETARVTARCHRNERLLSGGFANPDFDSVGGPQMFAHVSRKAGKKQRWTVAAHNLGSAPGTLVAFAYCRGG